MATFNRLEKLVSSGRNYGVDGYCVKCLRYILLFLFYIENIL